MATANAEAAVRETREYPTEWAIYPNDEPDRRMDRQDGEARNSEAAATAAGWSRKGPALGGTGPFRAGRE
jgi:hypothetical protein